MSNEHSKMLQVIHRVWAWCARAEDSRGFEEAPTPPPASVGNGAVQSASKRGGIDSEETTAMQDERTVVDCAGEERLETSAQCQTPGEPDASADATDARMDGQCVTAVCAREGADHPDSADANGLREFELAGGIVLPTPDNLGHLSQVYRLVRPKLIRTMLGELALPDTEVVRIRRASWQGCALAWAHDTGEPLKDLHTETAIHIGGKDVNQDSVGTCTGILRIEGKSEPFAVIAVADGVTSSLYSEFGALCAVGMAMRSSVGFLEACCRTQELPLLPTPEAGRLACWLCRDFPTGRTTIQGLQKAIMAALTEYITLDSADSPPQARGAARQHLRLLGEEGREHLSTTLIAICATPRWFTVAGFGNGMVWVGFSTGDIAASWQPDASIELKCRLSTDCIPQEASYTWAAPLEVSGIVAIGAGTDGIPCIITLRSALDAMGIEATAQNILDRIVKDQLEKCPRDVVDNAAMARIDRGIVD